MKVQLTITGDRPLLINNAQLANPMNAWARQLKGLTSKSKKTDEDLIQIMFIEARGGCYEADGGGELLGWPTENTWRSLHQAATAFKLGEAVKRAVRYEPITVPLLVDGGAVTIHDFLDTPGNIDYRSVKVQRARVMRSRPIIRGWSAVHSFDLDETALDPADLARIVERAGSYVGVGNWRPTYGTFRGEIA